MEQAHPGDHTPAGPNPTNHHDEGDDLDLKEILDSIAELHSGDRTRYPLYGTTGIPLGNAQSKAGMNFEASYCDESRNQVSVCHPSLANKRASPIVQCYQPNYRFGMQCQTELKTRLRARSLPRMIAELASEFESLVTKEHNNKEQVFSLIKDLFQIVQSWLDRLKKHPLHVRYEMTFVSDPASLEQILPPIKGTDSPIVCLCFAPKEDVLNSMKTLVDMHSTVLLDGLCPLQHHKHLWPTVTPAEWAAYIAHAESFVSTIGMGGGAMGSVLKQSLVHEPDFYITHYWMVHPEFITELPENSARASKLKYGVDPSLLAIPTAPPAPMDNSSNVFQLFLDYVDADLPKYLTGRLPRLDQPAAYRNCMQLIYTSFLAAGHQEEGVPSTHNLFDRVDWDKVGKKAQTVKFLLRNIAKALFALYKVEWAARNARFLKKKLHADIKIRMTKKEFVQLLRNVSTKAQLLDLIANHLGGTWPSCDQQRAFNVEDATLTDAGEKSNRERFALLTFSCLTLISSFRPPQTAFS